jgi:hypothetical protein
MNAAAFAGAAANAAQLTQREAVLAATLANAPTSTPITARAIAYHGAAVYNMRLQQSAKELGEMRGTWFIKGKDMKGRVRHMYTLRGGGAANEYVFHASHLHPAQMSSMGLELDRQSPFYMWERLGIHCFTMVRP